MIAPAAIVGQVHALLASARSLNHTTVHVDTRFLEEGWRLSGPDFLPLPVADVEQGLNVTGVEATTKITCGGWLWNAAGPQSVEEDFVLAQQLQIFQTGAAAKGVVSKGEHVIRVVIGQVQLEHMQVIVNGLRQAEFTH